MISEGIQAWCMDAAENDEEKAERLLKFFEAEVNRRLPEGGSIDLETCEPINCKIDSDTFNSLIQEVANKIAVENE